MWPSSTQPFAPSIYKVALPLPSSMKKLISAAVLAACIFAVGLDGAQITNPSDPNYGTNKVGQCYVKTLNNWTGISNTTANLNGYPIQCDQFTATFTFNSVPSYSVTHIVAFK